MKTKTKTCKYHCRACGAHFTSLVAFDSHRANLNCINPKGVKGLRQLIGECRISGAITLKDEAIFELEQADELRKYYENQG